jgi:hypothetical protein
MLTAIVFPTIADMGLLFFALAVLAFLYRSDKKMMAIVVAATIAAYSVLPSFWTWVTSRSFVADVLFAGTDEDRGGTAFVVDLRQQDGDVVEARARDVFYPPFYWHVLSGTVRSQLRVAWHDRTPVCVTLTGVRIPWYFPNVLAVENVNQC